MAEKCFEGDGLHRGVSCTRVQLKGIQLHGGFRLYTGSVTRGVQLHGGYPFFFRKSGSLFSKSLFLLRLGAFGG